jgi:hypothetical protein
MFPDLAEKSKIRAIFKGFGAVAGQAILPGQWVVSEDEITGGQGRLV